MADLSEQELAALRIIHKGDLGCPNSGREGGCLVCLLLDVIGQREAERDRAYELRDKAREQRDDDAMEWAGRYDDAVQPLQARCSEYLARAEQAEAALAQAIAQEASATGLAMEYATASERLREALLVRRMKDVKQHPRFLEWVNLVDNAGLKRNFDDWMADAALAAQPDAPPIQSDAVCTLCGDHDSACIASTCGRALRRPDLPSYDELAQPDATPKRRIECASCKKAPTDDPSIALMRVNVKGVPGVFVCQWCDKAMDGVGETTDGL